MFLMPGQFEKETLRIVIVGASIQPGLLHKELLVGAVRIPELEGDRVNGATIAISSIRAYVKGAKFKVVCGVV